MLTHLRIQSFKAWKDTGNIRLAPLTVFFGTNSSGKTSLHQLLLMLKQTAESPDRKRVLHLGDLNTAVDLGTFQDVVYGHQESATMVFELGWTLPKALVIEGLEPEPADEAQEVGFEAQICHESRAAGGLFVQAMKYRLLDPSGKSILEAGMSARDLAGHTYELEVNGYELLRNVGRPYALPPPVWFHGFPDKAFVSYKNAGFLSDLTLSLQNLLGSLHYVGPLRNHPRRSYVWSGEEPQDVGWRGERAIEALLAAKERNVSPGFHKRAQPFEAVAARWLKEMGLIESFSVKPIAKNRKEYEVLVRTRSSKHLVNLTDVGFGVSQVLPVIVQCFHAPRHAIVIFEQPEIHLHPNVQASLADLLIEATQAREDGQDRANQFLVESHSEHFLRRLQRRIAEERITPENVAIYFCSPGRDGAVLEELQVDEYGNIVNWPEDFFGDELGDLAAMTEAAMTRQMADAKQ